VIKLAIGAIMLFVLGLLLQPEATVLIILGLVVLAVILL
jgi:hypothetical protein